MNCYGMGWVDPTDDPADPSVECPLCTNGHSIRIMVNGKLNYLTDLNLDNRFISYELVRKLAFDHSDYICNITYSDAGSVKGILVSGKPVEIFGDTVFHVEPIGEKEYG